MKQLELNEERVQKTRKAWDERYTRARSRPSYPDEHLVRLLSAVQPGPALELGCGSGRHLELLYEQGFSPVYGTDTSAKSREMCAERYPEARIRAFQYESLRLDLPDHSQSAIVCWGVLHYNSEADIQALLTETRRLLRPGGVLLGTLRAAGDTHFADNPDMAQASLRLFSQDEARAILGEHYAHVELGYSERSPVGQLERRICHWTFRCSP